jgi:hypothetical protein
MLVSVSYTPSPSNEPTSSGIDSPNIGDIAGGVVAGAIIIVAVSLSLIVVLVLICKYYT